MAWTSITYKCGHDGREQLYGKHADRDNYVAWAQREKLCLECYRALKKSQGPDVTFRANGDGVQVLIANSYDQRALLKARGYVYTTWTPADAPLGVRQTKVGFRCAEIKGWSIQFSEASKLDAEIEWITQQGWPLKVVDLVMSGLWHSLGEGRRSLLESLNDRLAGRKTLATTVIPFQ